jgi:hypothetical protein
MTTDIIITIAGVFSSLAVIIAAVLASYKLAKKIDAAIGTDERGRSVSDRLDRVEHQLWENGGSSLADRVNNIEHYIIKVSTEIEFIKNLTLGIHNSSVPNSVPNNMVPSSEMPLLKKRVSRQKKAK